MDITKKNIALLIINYEQDLYYLYDSICLNVESVIIIP